MNMAPKSMRLQIALMGRANSGKSSFLNLISGQDVAITSSEIGTTTDVVEKNQIENVLIGISNHNLSTDNSYHALMHSKHFVKE